MARELAPVRLRSSRKTGTLGLSDTPRWRLFLGAASQPNGGEPPRHSKLPRHKNQRSTMGDKDIRQQLIARQTRQVQTPGKGVDAVGCSAD